MGAVPRGARSRGSMGRLVARDPGFARCSDVTGRAKVARPDQRPGGSGWNRGRVFRHRLRARLPVAALLRSSEPRRRCGTDRHRVSEAPEWQSITVRRTLLPRQERSSQTRNHGTTPPYGRELSPGTTRKGEVDSDSLFRVFRWIPWLIPNLLSSPAGR